MVTSWATHSQGNGSSQSNKIDGILHINFELVTAFNSDGGKPIITTTEDCMASVLPVGGWPSSEWDLAAPDAVAGADNLDIVELLFWAIEYAVNLETAKVGGSEGREEGEEDDGHEPHSAGGCLVSMWLKTI